MISRIFNVPRARAGKLYPAIKYPAARYCLIALVFIFPNLARAQLQEGEAYISCFPGVANGKIDVTSDSGGIVDMRSPGFAPTTNNWPAPMRDKVTPRDVGLIFGIAIDHEPTPNIYVANSAAFGLHIEDTAGSAIATGSANARWMDGQFGALSQTPQNPQGEPAIYKINSQTNAITRFGTLTNDGPGFGNIAFNHYTVQPSFYVSDLSNGLIYHLDQNGGVVGILDHGAAYTATPDNGAITDISSNLFSSTTSTPQTHWGVTHIDRLVWGLGVYKRKDDAVARLFYAVGRGTSVKIFSVSLGINGVIGNDITDENIDMSGINPSNYITDIAFSTRDEMMTAERGLKGTIVTQIFDGGFNFYDAHTNRATRFVWDNTLQLWILSPAPFYDIGSYNGGMPRANSTGGIDFSYGLDGDFNLDPDQCDDRFVAMGDFLQSQNNNRIYGLQNSPVANTGNVLQQSYFTDVDGDLSSLDKTQNGDVEVFRKACAVPAEPPTGATLKICKVAGEGADVGTPFEFGFSWGSDNQAGREEGNATIPAGPAPGGYCQVVATDVPTDRGIAIGELRNTGYVVTDIDVAGSGIPNVIDPDNRFVTLESVAAGVTEITFTNEYRTGFLEICKIVEEDTDAVFNFTIEETGEMISLPADTCSAAIELPAGNLTITEAAQPGWRMNGCLAYDPLTDNLSTDRVVNCDLTTGRTVFFVPPGDISGQTIAFIGNASSRDEPQARRSTRRRRNTKSRQRDWEQKIRDMMEGGR